ncbi:MAG: glycoside hydrolase family 3 N-terminal domain-containing protein [Spirochaetales bacterium]|nr:glycoside hydrolase family 3 N-terminal domain-containing protein [Spirochaetales bacterium]
MKRLSILILFLFSYSLYALPHFNDNRAPEELAHALVEAMTPEERLGQTLMFSWKGVDPSSDIHKWIRDYNLGGIKIFGWNGYDIKTLSATIGEYQEAALNNRFGIPLLSATDQEGGIVRHITDHTALTPGNMSIGASGLPLDAYNSGYLIGKELAAIGINMNFAPNVDLYLKPHTAVIGTRAFSVDAEETAFYSTVWYRGHADAGIVSTVKHYPGHGRSDEDSHGVLPIIDVSLDDLKKDDLLPYRMLINEGIPAVMASHLAYSRITGDTLPASRSSFFLEELLRDEMGFKGMVISDDMIMYGAIMGSTTIEQACEESMRTGVDMLLISQSPDTHRRVWNRLHDSMEEDEAMAERIKEAAYRVVLTKLLWLKGDKAVPYIPDSESVYDNMTVPAMEEHNLDLAARSITVFKDRDGKIPLDIEGDGKILLVTQDRLVREAVRERIPGINIFDLPSNPEPGELSGRLNSLVRIIDRYDKVIFSFRNGYDQYIAEDLEPWNDKIIFFITSNPSYSESIEWADTVVFSYIYTRESVDASVGVILGDYEAGGELPAELKGRG